MSNPQQPELRRSGKGDTVQDSWGNAAGSAENPGPEGAAGPVPEANQPGHHPEKEQDKPDVA
jgi:hypothetical protein